MATQNTGISVTPRHGVVTLVGHSLFSIRIAPIAAPRKSGPPAL